MPARAAQVVEVRFLISAHSLLPTAMRMGTVVMEATEEAEALTHPPALLQDKEALEAKHRAQPSTTREQPALFSAASLLELPSVGMLARRRWETTLYPDATVPGVLAVDFATSAQTRWSTAHFTATR